MIVGDVHPCPTLQPAVIQVCAKPHVVQIIWWNYMTLLQSKVMVTIHIAGFTCRLLYQDVIALTTGHYDEVFE